MDAELIGLLVENSGSVGGFIASIIGVFFLIVIYFLKREDARRKEEMKIRGEVYGKISEQLVSMNAVQTKQLTLIESIVDRLEKMNENQIIIKSALKNIKS